MSFCYGANHDELQKGIVSCAGPLRVCRGALRAGHLRSPEADAVRVALHEHRPASERPFDCEQAGRQPDIHGQFRTVLRFLQTLGLRVLRDGGPLRELLVPQLRELQYHRGAPEEMVVQRLRRPHPEDEEHIHALERDVQRRRDIRDDLDIELHQRGGGAERGRRLGDQGGDGRLGGVGDRGGGAEVQVHAFDTEPAERGRSVSIFTPRTTRSAY